MAAWTNRSFPSVQGRTARPRRAWSTCSENTSLRHADGALHLRSKRVTAHSLRHSAAMEWLQKGVDRAVIALLLGHESAETTDVYLHESMDLKERAVARTRPKTFIFIALRTR